MVPLPNAPEIRIEPAADPLDPEIERRLRHELDACPDVAFAHLRQVTVEGHQLKPSLSLFVWLVPEAVSSLRASLNLVCEAVARAIPDETYLDVLILNSVPELLAAVESAGCPIVERDPSERQRALEAAEERDDDRALSEPASV
jgi:hypothetical protein